MTGNRLLLLLTLLAATAHLFAQAHPESSHFGAVNTFSLFGEYSNDSSHILLGSAEDRKLFDLGLGYSRRIFTTRVFDFRYMAEVRPMVLIGDPVVDFTTVFTEPYPSTESGSFRPVTACHPGSFAYSSPNGDQPLAYTQTVTCGRAWTYGQELSPAGIKINFQHRHRLQPVFTASGGYIFTTQPVPVASAGSANFTFELGAGLEIFRSSTSSICIEYRYNHISNNYTAMQNPGIDNGLLQVGWSFGRR